MESGNSRVQEVIEKVQQEVALGEGDSPTDLHIITGRRLVLFGEISQASKGLTDAELGQMVKELVNFEMSEMAVQSL